jgi:hypothetical protein
MELQYADLSCAVILDGGLLSDMVGQQPVLVDQIRVVRSDLSPLSIGAASTALVWDGVVSPTVSEL